MCGNSGVLTAAAWWTQSLSPTLTHSLYLPLAQLRSLAADELVAGTVIVVLANKSDAEGAHSTAWLASTLQLQTMLVGHPWVIVPSCALTGAGVDEGLKFLVDNL